jgi:hypothetical protein
VGSPPRGNANTMRVLSPFRMVWLRHAASGGGRALESSATVIALGSTLRSNQASTFTPHVHRQPHRRLAGICPFATVSGTAQPASRALRSNGSAEPQFAAATDTS